MRNLNSRGIAIVIVITMVLGSMLFLLGSENANGQERDNEKKITWGRYRQRNPTIYGNRITWDTYGSEIYTYDITTEEIRRETTGARGSYSDIYGDYVVYQDYRTTPTNYDIYLVDTRTNIEYQMYDGSDQQHSPSIWGEDIVWQEKDGNFWRIAVGYARSNSYFYIGWGPHNQSNPDIWGRSVVYEDDINGNVDIYYWDRVDREEIRLTNNESNQRDPRIYGTKVVWTDYRNLHTDIYMYDLMTDTETRITTNESDQRYPVIHEDIIVWQDFRNGNWDIYMMDLNDGIPIQVTDNSSGQSQPDIYGDVIVWFDQRPGPAESSGDLNIYMTHIDQDDDGIYDWDDPQPTIPHFPLEGLQYQMDMLMTQLKMTELNLTGRIQSLQTDIAAGFVGLSEDLMDEIEDGVDEILADIDTHDRRLSGTNNTIRIEFASIKEELISMTENQTIGEQEELDMINSYLGTLEELILQVRASIETALSELGTEIEENIDVTSSNYTTKLESIQTSLDELQKLDEIVTDLETISKDVEKMDTSGDDEGIGFFETIVIILLILILFMVFLGMFKRRGPLNNEDEEDWN